MKKYLLIFIACFTCGKSFAIDETSPYLDNDIDLMKSALTWVQRSDKSKYDCEIDLNLPQGMFCNGAQDKIFSYRYITVWTTPDYSKDALNDFVIQIQGQSDGTYSCELMFNSNIVPNISELVPGCS